MSNVETNANQPGPQAEEWLKRSKCSKVQAPSHIFAGLVTLRGEGSYVFDVDGKRYIDFTAQRFSLGYCHPRVAEAIKHAVARGGDVDVTAMIACAEKLKEIAPPNLSNGLVHFTRGGTLATEHAILALKRYSGRTAFLACQGSYHGSAFASLSLTMDRSEMRRGLYPFMSDVVHVPYAYCYRCPHGQEYPSCDLRCIEYIRYVLDTVIHPDDTAGFFVEPVQTHSGIVVPPDGYLQGVRRICDERNIPLVDDEIVTGLGRTGKMFGIENWNVRPDIILLGKPLGSPLTLGAVIGKRAIMEAHKDGSGGAPIPCAAALAMIEAISEERLMENALKTGEYILKRLKELQEKHEIIGDIRGKGLLIGLEFVQDLESKKPATKEARNIVAKAYENGLLILLGGTYSQSVRLSPPLNLTREQAEEAVGILEKTLKDLGL